MTYTKTSLCQLHGGCVGCCGHDYPSSQQVEIAIDKNTLEFADYKDPKKFRDRFEKDKLRHGLCRNAVRYKGNVLCGIHPEFISSSTDLRKDHCDIRYLCKSAKAFKEWDKPTRDAFTNFLEQKRKRMTQIEYSLAIDNDSLLKEFEDAC